jgi:hypothetical protein
MTERKKMFEQKVKGTRNDLIDLYLAKRERVLADFHPEWQACRQLRSIVDLP